MNDEPLDHMHSAGAEACDRCDRALKRSLAQDLIDSLAEDDAQRVAQALDAILDEWPKR